MEKKTPLYSCHLEAGGKIVPFAGYLLPVQYETGVIAEHIAVRTACGLFDVSHMGEIVYKGPDAFKNVQYIITNDCSGMYDGQVRYSPMCNNSGGVVDDVLVYKISDQYYMLVVNAANRDKDFAWMKSNIKGDAVIEDISDSIAQIALQGPAANSVLKKLIPEKLIPGKYYSFIKDADLLGLKCLISSTGYTGELGYEIYCPEAEAGKIWELLLNAGKDNGLIPCGLGARDTLRMEAGMPLYGHEMDETVTPLEAGLDFFVKLNKDDFAGKAALISAGIPKQIRVGLAVTGRGIVREHCDLYLNGVIVGHTTSGTFCPFVNKPIAMASLKTEFTKIGTKFEADVRGRRIEVEVIPLPFYKRPKKATQI